VAKALDSGSSQLCWRGFDPHRMYFYVSKSHVFFYFAFFTVKISPRGDSNPQPPDPKSDALSIAPLRQIWNEKSGGAGYRSLCLTHAKRALYHLSYTPKVCIKRSWSSGYDRRLPSDGPGFNSRRAHFFFFQTNCFYFVKKLANPSFDLGTFRL
jgi:hypothetical protein